MPRLIHRLPKLRKHRASGQALVTLNGHDHYLGRYGTKSSKQQYDRLCGEYLSSEGALLQDSRDELSIVELLDGFARYAKSYYSPDSSEPHNKLVIKRLRIA